MRRTTEQRDTHSLLDEERSLQVGQGMCGGFYVFTPPNRNDPLGANPKVACFSTAKEAGAWIGKQLEFYETKRISGEAK